MKAVYTYFFKSYYFCVVAKPNSRAMHNVFILYYYTIVIIP